MTKGAMPVQYVVAIIFAILVIALLAYLFYKVFIEEGDEFKDKQCLAKMVEWCELKRYDSAKMQEMCGYGKECVKCVAGVVPTKCDPCPCAP